MLNPTIKKCIEKSVLCWLATCNEHLFPNVSPKEMFTYVGESTIIIANLASPNSVNNILVNPNVCVSFIDIFVQKGFKILGKATIIDKNDPNFGLKVKPITDLYSNKFPIKGVIEIEIKKVDIIQAPSYFLYPERTEQFQIESAMNSYKVKPIN